MSIEAMKQALEALALFASDESDDGQMAISAYEALRQAIAEAEKQEPVAFVSGYYGGQCVILPIYKDKLFSPGTALYTTPVHASENTEKQEPVGWLDSEGRFSYFKHLDSDEPLYAAPVHARPVVHAVRCTYPQCQATNGCVGACSKTAPVHASDISQEPVDETAKDRHELEEMVKRGTKAWAGTPDDWVDDLRGGADMSDYDKSIHGNPDAQAWAKFFIDTMAEQSWRVEDIDEGLMTGWFANAMMAMHDHVKRKWVGLTDEEREAATGWSVEHIEAKLREKNS